ncbi:carbon-nitrogen hydrolase [Phascolomyces articulosus]|uniref:Carbon-nitrogen hydrolase n=1 Tax=Phascolomyces articulosus TaxID=60185 RepID=A0AAD5KAQ9_9FUNG|nr:carbon-nitrogen hydrolase [Phascolomyces articulosus]
MTLLEKLKVQIIEHSLILPLFVVGLFAGGLQSIPLLTVFYFPLLLHYTRIQWYNVITGFIVHTLSFWISILGLPDGLQGGDRFQHPWLTLGVSIAACISVLIPLAGDFLASRHDNVALRLLVFPLLFTGFWMGVCGHLFGFGDGLAYSNNILLAFPDVVQGAAWLGGRPAIDFVLSLFATVLREFDRPSFEKPPVFNSIEEDDEQEQQQQQQQFSVSNNKKPWFLHHAIYYACLLIVLGIFGGGLIQIRPGSFFQIAYPDYVPETVPVGCVIGPGGIHPELQEDHDRWFNRTTKLVESGAKLVVWSEETAITHSSQEENDLINRAREYAIEKQIYLAIAYDNNVLADLAENKLVIVSPLGEVKINYRKAHPVPIVELSTPGAAEIQFFDTPEFGRIGGAICFDYNFPWFIRQASENNIDLMIQPSFTWGPIGTYHSRSNSLRAVENGFTMFRCGSQGLSGVFEPTLNGVFNQHVAAITDSEYLFHLPIQKRRKTLYGYIGDVFGFTCLYVGLLTIFYLVYYTTVKKLRGGQIQV